MAQPLLVYEESAMKLWTHPMTAPTTPRSMIVAERGGDWARWVERFREDTPDVVVVLQHEGESMAQLAARVRERLDAMVTAGAMPANAVVVGGGRTDQVTLASRATILRSIAKAMAAFGGGSVQLDSSGADKYSMVALAAATSMMVQGTGVRVTAGAGPQPLAA